MSHAVVASLLTVVLGGAPAGPAAEPPADTVPTSEPSPTTEVAPAPETAAPQAPPVSSPAPVSEPTPAPEVAPSPSPTATSAAATQPVSTAAEPEPEIIGPLAAREREIQQDPELHRRDRQATNLVITGSVGVGFGLATLLLVSAPMHAFYRDSLDEAEETRWVTSQDELIQDALRRRRIMLISAGIGAGLTTVGAAILAVGLSQRARLRRPRDTLSLAPIIGGGHLGVAASMRF